MPTPKPGQIRCPTCQQPTPPAAYCTQCGAPLPSSLQARPRGMDRAELEERVRHRRPGDPAMRRGRSPGEEVPPAGYVPFQPEPEDASAVREEDPAQPAQHVDNTPPDFDETPPVPPPSDPYRPPPAPATYGAAAVDEAAYGAQDAYPYTYPVEGGRSDRGGSGALPIIGFILLGVMALVVGGVLATLLGGNGGVGQASPTPTSATSVPPSEAPSTTPPPASEPPSSTPEPTDGPVTFPDGAVITVQPCATQDMSFDGCLVDGSTINAETMWVWIGFDDANGSDTFVLVLRSEGQTIDQQEKVLGELVGCPGTCSGYLIGAAYRDLESGEYELVVRRNDDFADSATFRVEG